MGLPNYPRPTFEPSVLGSSFGLKRGPGYHIGRAASLGLESGPVSPFLQPYQKRFEVNKSNPNPHFLVFWLGKTPNLNKSVFIGCSKLFFWLFDWLWSSNEKFFYKGNVGFLRGDVKNFPKLMFFFFFFCHNLAITYPN